MDKMTRGQARWGRVEGKEEGRREGRKARAEQAGNVAYKRTGATVRILFSRAATATVSQGCTLKKSELKVPYMRVASANLNTLACYPAFLINAVTCFAARSYLGGFMLPNFSMALQVNTKMHTKGFITKAGLFRLRAILRNSEVRICLSCSLSRQEDKQMLPTSDKSQKRFSEFTPDNCINSLHFHFVFHVCLRLFGEEGRI